MLKDHIRSKGYINQLDQHAKVVHCFSAQSGAILWMLSILNHFVLFM